MKIFLLLSSVLSALATFASAERVVRSIYYQGSDDAPRKAFLYGVSGKHVEVNFPRSNISDAVELPDGGEIFSLLPAILPEDGAIPKNAPQVGIPKDWKLSALLISKDEGNPVLPVRATPVNMSDSVFRPGEMLWINLTDIMVGGKIGDTKLLLKPKGTELLKAPKSERGDYPVVIDCLIPGDKETRWLVRQTWRHTPRARQLVFVQPLEPPRIATLHSVSFYE
jgi:hypothetical protein